MTAAAILRRLAVPGEYLAAAIFALHPAHVESVAWISEQKNTLSAVLYLAAAMAYLRFDQSRTGRPRKMTWYLGACGLFVMAVLSRALPPRFPAGCWWSSGGGAAGSRGRTMSCRCCLSFCWERAWG